MDTVLLYVLYMCPINAPCDTHVRYCTNMNRVDVCKVRVNHVHQNEKLDSESETRMINN